MPRHLSLFFLFLLPAYAYAQGDLGPPVTPSQAFSLVELRGRGSAGTAHVLVDAGGRAAVTRIEQGAVFTLPTIQLAQAELGELEAAVRMARLGQPGAELLPFAPQAAHLTLRVHSSDPDLAGERIGFDTLPLADLAAEGRLRAVITRVLALSRSLIDPPPFDFVKLVTQGPGLQPTTLRVTLTDSTVEVREENAAVQPPVDTLLTRSITVAERTRLLDALKNADMHRWPSTPLPAVSGLSTAPVQLEVLGTQHHTLWKAEAAGSYPTQHAGAQRLLEVVLEVAKPLRLPSATSGITGALSNP